MRVVVSGKDFFDIEQMVRCLGLYGPSVKDVIIRVSLQPHDAPLGQAGQRVDF